MANLSSGNLRPMRWYDRYPNIRSIILEGKALPRPIQESIGECLLLIAEEYWITQEKTYRIRSLRKPYLIVSLYKSQQNRRWYDTIPEMHNAINLMMHLPEFAMRQIDDQCASLLESVRAEKKNLLFVPEEYLTMAFMEVDSHLYEEARKTAGL